MSDLDDLLQLRPNFDLGEFVETANELLSRYLPTDVSDARIKSEVNPRLVRHYASEGMLDVPLKQGREARYTVDHLLQLLALRRLLADGLSTNTIGESLKKEDRNELRRIVEQGSTGQITPPKHSPDAALSAIERIQSRSASGVVMIQSYQLTNRREPEPTPKEPSTIPSSAVPSATNWDHYTLLDGVELRVRSDVKVPTSPESQNRLLDHITRLLIQIAQRRIK